MMTATQPMKFVQYKNWATQKKNNEIEKKNR